MTRGVVRDAARVTVTVGKGRRAGLAVRPRNLSFAHAGLADTVTRIAPAVITMANSSA